MTKTKKAAAVAAICVTCIGGYEGLRTTAYRDASPAEIWTYCYGETKGVTKDSKATPQQCRKLLVERVQGDFIPGVEACVTREMPVKVEAAFVSMAYNVGIVAFCKSIVVRRWNAGDGPGACNAMPLYVHAGDKILPGLVKRRAGERDLCMQGLA